MTSRAKAIEDAAMDVAISARRDGGKWLVAAFNFNALRDALHLPPDPEAAGGDVEEENRAAVLDIANALLMIHEVTKPYRETADKIKGRLGEEAQSIVRDEQRTAAEQSK